MLYNHSHDVNTIIMITRVIQYNCQYYHDHRRNVITVPQENCSSASGRCPNKNVLRASRLSVWRDIIVNIHIILASHGLRLDEQENSTNEQVDV